MGAIFISKILPEKIRTRRQVELYFKKLHKKTISKYKKDKEYWSYIKNNSNGLQTDYRGDWSTFLPWADCFETHDGDFASAKETIMKESKKWGEVRAVRYINRKNQIRWLIGGWAAC